MARRNFSGGPEGPAASILSVRSAIFTRRARSLEAERRM